MNDKVLIDYLKKINQIQDIMQNAIIAAKQLELSESYNSAASHDTFLVLSTFELNAIKKAQKDIKNNFVRQQDQLPRYQKKFISYCVEQITLFVTTLTEQGYNVKTWLDLNNSGIIRLEKAVKELKQAEAAINDYISD